MRKLRLLIVDDEQAIRNGLHHLIQWNDIGIEVVGTAKDGIDAYEQILLSKPQIVIVDINMPNMNGLELIEKTLSKGLNIKYIILSGYDDFSYAQKAIFLKVSSYLLKPVKTDRLIEEVLKITHILTEEQEATVTTHNVIRGQHALKEQFFNTLIDYKLRNLDEINQHYSELNLMIPLEKLILITFSYRYKASVSTSEFTQEDHRLFRFSVKNILLDCLQDDKLEFIEKSSSKTSIVLPQDLYTLDELKKKCTTCIDFIYNYAQIKVTAGISMPIHHLKDLSLAYYSSIEALSYKLYSPTQKVYTPVTPSLSENLAPQTTSLNTSKIIDAIIRIDLLSIQTATEEFLNQLFYIPTPPPKYIKGMCSYLIIDVQKKLETYNYFPDSPIIHQEKINFSDSFQEIKRHIIELFSKYSLDLKEANLLVQDPIIDEVKHFLQHQLGQKVLLSDIAKHVHLSESYLASYFKKKTGGNFRDYVIKTRMDIAKSQLRNTKKPISEISLELGYSDYRSFNRVFKKYTGKTPTEYYSTYHRGKNHV